MNVNTEMLEKFADARAAYLKARATGGKTEEQADAITATFFTYLAAADDVADSLLENRK